MSTDGKKVMEKLLANPTFNSELNRQLIAAKASFRKKGLPEENLQAYLQEYTVAFVKQFLRAMGEIDQKEPPTIQSQNKKAAPKRK